MNLYWNRGKNLELRGVVEEEARLGKENMGKIGTFPTHKGNEVTLEEL